jgi:hypothetical protein
LWAGISATAVQPIIPAGYGLLRPHVLGGGRFEIGGVKVSLIVAHDDPRVRAANETASIGVTFAHVQFHNFLLRPN